MVGYRLTRGMRFVRVRGDPPDTLDVDAIREAVSVDGVALTVVFGSVARDDAGSLSDLDVAVRFETEVDPPERRRLLDELTVSIQASTGFEAVDLVDLDAVGPELGYEALARGVLVYGDMDDALDLEAKLLLEALDFQPVKRAWQEALDGRIRGGTFGGS